MTPTGYIAALLSLSSLLASASAMGTMPRECPACECPKKDEPSVSDMMRNMPDSHEDDDAYVEEVDVEVPASLHMGFDRFKPSRKRRSVSYPTRPTYELDDSWYSFGANNDRKLFRKSKFYRAKDYLRRQYELYGPPIKVKDGKDGHYFPDYELDYYYNFPDYGYGYGDPYEHYGYRSTSKHH